MPEEPNAIALVRMVMMTAVTELQPATVSLTRPAVGLETAPDRLESDLKKVLQFYENLLGNPAYFAGESLTLADIVAGTLVPALPMLGISLNAYPQIESWLKRLSDRSSWQQTTPPAQVITEALPIIKGILARRS